MGMLPSSALREFELHLLVCHPCQDRMAEMDAFVAAMRAACREPRSTPRFQPAEFALFYQSLIIRT